jgi:hypothetical protein
LNNRPRKRLGFKTPKGVFHQSLKRAALRPWIRLIFHIIFLRLFLNIFINKFYN